MAGKKCSTFSMMMMTMGVKVLGTGELVGILAQHF